MSINQNEFEEKFVNFIGINHANFEFSGFVYKSPKKEIIERIGLTLDLCIESVEKAIESDLGVLICFHSPDQIDNKKVLSMVDGKLNLYKCHLPLNFADKIGIHATMGSMAGLIVEPVTFEYENNSITGGIYRVIGEYTLDEIEGAIKNIGCPYIRVFNNLNNNRIYKKILMSSGSGFKKEMFDQLDCDLIISGEAKHGMIIKARDMGITMVELGHYYSENGPLRIISEKLENHMGITVKYINVPFIEKIHEFKK